MSLCVIARPAASDVVVRPTAIHGARRRSARLRERLEGAILP